MASRIARIVVEEMCKEHGEFPCRQNVVVRGRGETLFKACQGGRRRVLTEGEYVLIEKVVITADVKEWPDKVLFALEGKHWTGIAETLDALAGGES